MMRQGFKFIVTPLVWAGLIFLLFRVVGQFPGPDEWAAYLTGQTAIAAAIFALCFTVATALRAVRFAYLTRLGADISWRALLAGFPWLFLLGAITPFRLGEGYRAKWVADRGGSAGEALGYWFGERFTDLMVLASLFLLGLWGMGSFSVIAPQILLGLLGLGLLCYVLLWFGHRQMAAALSQISWVPRGLTRLIEAFAYMRRPEVHAVIVGLTLLIWAAIAGGFWSVFALLGPQPALGLMVAFACMGAVNFAGLMSAAPANVGSYQAAMVAVLSLTPTLPDDALILAVLIQATGLAVTLLLGLASWALTKSPQTAAQ